MRIFLEMDGVVGDIETCLIQKYNQQYPTQPLGYSTHPLLIQDRQIRHRLRKIFNESGFFSCIPLMSGAKEAIEVMTAMGWEVYFCSIPKLSNSTSASEKYEWIEKHFGMGRNLILTKDKTLLHADILVDPRLDIRGSHTPTWEHIVFKNKWNKDLMHRTQKRVVSWNNWKDIFS